MSKHFASRSLIAGLFVALAMLGTNLAAQVSPHVPMGNSPQKTNTPSQGAQNRNAAAERNPSCQKIIQECKNLGFIVGEWKQDNGLWKDCFDPVVHGGQATRDGKSISVPVSPSDVQACRSGAGNRMNQNANRPMKPNIH